MAALILYLCLIAAGTQVDLFPLRADWPQWRGPYRDGRVAETPWPSSLDENHLKPVWRATLGPSYSGPVVAGQLVFVTESTNQLTEAVHRPSTGRPASCAGARNGRVTSRCPSSPKPTAIPFGATPVYADGPGSSSPACAMSSPFSRPKPARTRGASISARDQDQPVPALGFVSSPLVVGDAVYVQAGAAFVKLDTRSGRILWRTLADEGGMWGSAFDGHAYLHLRNQRLTCLDLNTGFSTWTSEEKFGKYWSLILNQDRILALDERGWLFLLEANPRQLEILSRRRVSELESWAHLALDGPDLYIRDLRRAHRLPLEDPRSVSRSALTCYIKWKGPTHPGRALHSVNHPTPVP